MIVVVNGRDEQLEQGVTVSDLLRRLGRDPGAPGTAVARNGEVVPRRAWATADLADGDRLEVLDAVGGG